jgi:hypothetical protein
MSDADVRDERVAELLDRAVRSLEPATAPERAIRRGNWRRALRLAAAIVTVAAFVSGAILAAAIVGTGGGRPADESTIVAFTSHEAPWAFAYPSTWSVRTTERAGPELKVNILRTTVANGPVPAEAEYAPNSSANATALFGDDGAVVLVERLWTHAAPLGGQNQGPGSFAEDAQNPGWTFRERSRCEGTLCFHVIEWLGPAASEEDRAASAAIADSARLAGVERWTETDGVRTTLHDEDDLFTVTYPSDWIVSDEPINDWVCSPFEILALATYPLRPGGEAVIDAQLPSNAVDDLGPNDILIWVNDGGNACGAQRTSGDGSGFPERPERFGPSEPCESWTRLCLEPDGHRLGLTGIRAWWLGFADAGRGFYVFVGMGEKAYDDDVRAQLAWDVLDSFRFLPR